MNRPQFFGMPGQSLGLTHGVGYQPIGKMTNNQDPKAKAARVFVGNLNTGVIKEQEMINIFQKYGPILAISLMKGYGFVQFTNEYHARKAVQGEHGHVLADQPVDLRIADNPNPTRPKGFKRISHQFGYQPYIDPNLLPVHPSASNGIIHDTKPVYPTASNGLINDSKSMAFQHNSQQVVKERITGDEPPSWICAFCQNEFLSSWELMKHASVSHQTHIYMTRLEFDRLHQQSK